MSLLVTLRIVCFPIECGCQVFWSKYWDFTAANSKAFFLNSKFFSQYYIAYLEFTLTLEHFGKEMNLMALVFPKSLTPKNKVT